MVSTSDRLDLQIDEAFQRAEWRWQRVGWVIWSLIILAALAGLLGPGPLSRASASSSTGALRVKFDRVVRHHHKTRIELHVRSGGGDQPVRLQMSHSLLDGLEIQRMDPEPQIRELAPDGVIFTWAKDASAAEAKIVLHVEYVGMGKHAGQIRLVEDEPVQIAPFVYP